MQPFSNQKRFLHTAGILTAVYLCAVFLVHPLVFSNLYFNITETKQAFYLILSGLYLLLLLFAAHRFFRRTTARRPRTRHYTRPCSRLPRCLSSVSSARLSADIPARHSWVKITAYQGLLTLLCYALVAFALSRRVIDLRWPERAFLLAAVLVSLLGILNHFGIDPFGFYSRLRQSDQGRFLSTIGNADFFGGYLVMAFTVLLGYFPPRGNPARSHIRSCRARLRFLRRARGRQRLRSAGAAGLRDGISALPVCRSRRDAKVRARLGLVFSSARLHSA